MAEPVSDTSSSNAQARILLYVRNDSRFQDLMIDQEVFVMRDKLEASGYAVDILTQNDEPLTGEVTLAPNKRLADIVMMDYAGLALPCMAPEPTKSPPDDMVSLAKQAKSLNLPVAAMRGSVWALAHAGLLVGRRYAYATELDLPEFADATFVGTDVTVDGPVATAGICPTVVMKRGGTDQTAELTDAFLEVLESQRNG
jgi:putative intracellular protease/amidase